MSPLKKFWMIVSLTLVGVVLFAPAAFAIDEVVAASIQGGSRKFLGFGVGFGLAFAAAFGALAQGRAAAAALEGMARNPNAKLMPTLILSLALIESLVIYSLVMSFLLLGKV